MKIEKYEIDMLNVGAADALLIRFWDETDKAHVILVDAGNYNDGKKVSDFIQTRYNTNNVDLAICTHCDDDHYGGFIYILEKMQQDSQSFINIKRMVVNDPGNHINIEDVKWYRNEENLKKEARAVFTINNKNLFEELNKSNVPYTEGFSDENSLYFNGAIRILGPTKDYYKKLSFNFRNKIHKYDDEEDFFDSPNYLDFPYDETLSKTMDEATDDPSAHNQSSIIFVFTPDGENKYLFMGDSGREAFYELKDKDYIKDVFWLKVPHHGSKHNMNSEIINHIHPKTAYISTEKVGHYLNKAVVNAFNKIGTNIYSTHKQGCMLHHIGNTPKRSDYVPVEPLNHERK